MKEITRLIRLIPTHTECSFNPQSGSNFPMSHMLEFVNCEFVCILYHVDNRPQLSRE
jgi:hypothetical protein